MSRIRPFRDWSIGHKLTALFITMAFVTAMFIVVAIGAFDLWGLEQAMIRDQATLADVLGRNSTAAITFHDADVARDVLQALKAEPGITAACIYTNEGHPLATYMRQGNAIFNPPRAEKAATRLGHRRLVLFRSIDLKGETVGTIYIESDLERLEKRSREYALAMLIALLLTLAVAFPLASRLKRPITHPLFSLVHTAKAISDASDYSLRAGLPNQDEFGQLVSAFNSMLDQIEKRNHELRHHHEHLEEEVAARTADLRKANTRVQLQAAALEAAANSILITDLQGTVVWTNAAFSSLTGYSSDEVRGRTPRILRSEKQEPEFYKRLWSTIRTGAMWNGELINRRKDGSLYTEEMTITPVALEKGEISHFVAIKQDITARREAEEALRRAEEKYRAIFEDAVVGIFQVSADGRPLRVNAALARMHGYDSPEQFLAEMPEISPRMFADPTRMNDLKDSLDQHRLVRGIQLQIVCRDHSKKWVMANVRAVHDVAGKLQLYEGTVEDITDRIVAEERVQFLAYYDLLTGLPNRVFLLDRLAQALDNSHRRSDGTAVLFLDLDRFKIINDSLGHSVGDLILQEVAERLRRCVRDQDTVARIGGDEFLIVLAGVSTSSEVSAVAERILDLMTHEFVVHGRSLGVSCSIGISMFPEHGCDAETLIKNADAAMYSAKEAGSCMFRFFDDAISSDAVERLTLENSLREALTKNQFSLVYQPQMEIATGRITGLEALLRWEHPELGLVPPDKFIRVAENSGLIVPIGEWVLRTACSQIRKWQDEGFEEVPVAVNVSAVQFRQVGLPLVVETVLNETGLSAHLLELELTESLLLSNADVMFAVLTDLRSMGVKLAIDDFGTGYSSLSYLKELPVGKLKIDRSFIRDVTASSDAAAITTCIIQMAKSLNLRVIAEGVESEGQMSFLRSHGCDEVQGYLSSAPLTVDQVSARLRRGQGRRVAADLTAQSALS